MAIDQKERKASNDTNGRGKRMNIKKKVRLTVKGGGYIPATLVAEDLNRKYDQTNKAHMVETITLNINYKVPTTLYENGFEYKGKYFMIDKIKSNGVFNEVKAMDKDITEW